MIHLLNMCASSRGVSYPVRKGCECFDAWHETGFSVADAEAGMQLSAVIWK